MPSYGASVKLSGNAPSVIGALRKAIDDKSYQPAVGEAGAAVLQEHFRELEFDAGAHASASRLGAQPSGLYAELAHSTTWAATSAGLRLSIVHAAARQRIEGGEIRPVNADYLTIPANAQAYGRTARTVGVRLEMMIRRVNGAVRPVALQDEQGEIYYWLVKSVVQRPDPDVLPTDDELIGGIMDALDGWLDGLTGGSRG